MVSIPRFLRKYTPDDVVDDISDMHIGDVDIRTINPPSTVISAMPTYTPQRDHPRPVSADPIHKSLLARIALVSVEDQTQLPAILNDEDTHTDLIQLILLPRNPRIAGDELYELDGMDLIVIIPEANMQISRDTMRWLQLLKQLGVPMILMLPQSIRKRRERNKVSQLAHHIDLPIIAINANDLAQARQHFVMQMMQLAPATGLALAAQLPHFRIPLLRNIIDEALTNTHFT